MDPPLPLPLPRVRQAQWLVAPFLTLAAVVVLLVVARFYDRLPLKPPPCGFKVLLGIPCAGCGGTRAMVSLSHGRVTEAIRFHPAAVAGVFASAAWATLGWRRFRAGAPLPPVSEQNRRILRNLLAAGILVLANWAYLVCFLP